MKLLRLLVLPLLLASCSSAGTIADEPWTSGEAHSFSASYDDLKKIIPQAIKETGVHITKQTENDQGETFMISHGVSAFSWGEIGRVVIERNHGQDGTTLVHALLQRRAGGFEKGSYPSKLFAKIDSELSNVSEEKR